MVSTLKPLPLIVSEKITSVASVIVIYFLLLFAAVALNIALPLWLFGLITLILFLMLLIILRGSTQPAQGQQPIATRYAKIKSRILGAGGFLLFWGIVLAIFLAAYWQSVGPASETWDLKEFQDKALCTGKCEIKDGSLVLYSGASVSLNETENISSIGRVVVVLESIPDGMEFWTMIGPYKFWTGSDDTQYYGKIFLMRGDKSDDKYVYTYIRAKKSESGDSIVIRTNNYDRCPFGICGSPESPDIEIGDGWISRYSLVTGLRHSSDPEVIGKITINAGAGQTIKIKEVRIYYGSVRQRISHLIFG